MQWTSCNEVERINLSLPKIVGKGYGTFWRCKKRNRAVKGSRASKKSKTIALNFIYRIMKYPEANLLVVRKVFGTIKDSCYSDLKWAIHRFKVDDLFECKLSPLEIVYKPTGQKILFRGLDDPFKITSISVDVGYLCWLWIEEAYEISKESDFDTLNESIRGYVPDYLFKQVTLSFNPWNEKCWIKKRFFDTSDEDTLAITTNYMCNEWLDDTDRNLFEKMKRDNPRRYQVAGLGNWGISEGLVYENWEEKAFDVKEISQLASVTSFFGLDFGYTNDPSALCCGLIDKTSKTIWIFDELYKKGQTNRMLAEAITEKGYAKERIICDSAEPKSIAELKNEYGISRVKPAVKGKDSINNGIQQIQNYKIFVHPRCVNFITEIGNYTWEVDKAGNKLNVPIDDFNHLMDAFRYAVMSILKPSSFSFD